MPVVLQTSKPAGARCDVHFSRDHWIGKYIKLKLTCLISGIPPLVSVPSSLSKLAGWNSNSLTSWAEIFTGLLDPVIFKKCVKSGHWSAYQIVSGILFSQIPKKNHQICRLFWSCQNEFLFEYQNVQKVAKQLFIFIEKVKNNI